MAKAKAPVANEIQVFEEFTDKEVLTISKFSEKKFYQRSETVFKENSQDASLYVVLKGQLEALAHTSDGKKISLSMIDEGEVFGELSFLDGKARSATIIAVKDVELLQITRDDFENLRVQHPDIASKLIMDLARVVSLRLRNADKFIVDIFQLINNNEASEESNKAKVVSKTKKAPAKAVEKKAETKAVKKEAPKAKAASKTKKAPAKAVEKKAETKAVKKEAPKAKATSKTKKAPAKAKKK
ncbi:MAG: cyclic nucleotide-binding domain-containing protein [Candidatus Sericytochromatia bacterium]